MINIYLPHAISTASYLSKRRKSTCDYKALSFSFISHLQSRRVILWSTESSEDPLLFLFPATSHDVGIEEASCVTKMEEHTGFLDRRSAGLVYVLPK